MRHLRTVLPVLLVATLAVGTGAASAERSQATSVDLLAEPMVDLAGLPASLADYRGEVLVVNFWASWCAPCREELPVLDAWNQEWSGREARVVAVSIDKQLANAVRFAATAELGLTILVDGPDGLAASLDLAAVPSTYLLDRDGRVVQVVRGSGPAELDRLKRAAEALLDRSGERTST